jgi:hypothetical protein
MPVKEINFEYVTKNKIEIINSRLLITHGLYTNLDGNTELQIKEVQRMWEMIQPDIKDICRRVPIWIKRRTNTLTKLQLDSKQKATEITG